MSQKTIGTAILEILQDNKKHSYDQLGKTLNKDPFKIFLACLSLEDQNKISTDSIVLSSQPNFEETPVVRLKSNIPKIIQESTSVSAA